MNGKPSPLHALTAAALALPGMAEADVKADVMQAHYQEADLPAGRAAGQRSSERYTIDSTLFRLYAPVGDDLVQVDATYESMSGASPWYVIPGNNGPKQVMSGASIAETRVAAQGQYTRQIDPLKWTLSAGGSTEDDYRSVNGGLEAEFQPRGAQHSYTAGIGYSYDQLNPTVGASSPNVIDKADKDSLNAYAGVSWIINTETVVQTAVSYTHSEGYLSDPYKQAFIIDQAGTVRDRRPDKRQEVAITGRLRHYVSAFGAALHLDYRYYQDDWDITAHTLELSWNQIIAGRWRVAPGLRWYSQSQAGFYAPYYATARGDGYASSDYRLSPFGALSARLDVNGTFGGWLLGVGSEWYDSDARYALGSVKVENPGLVDYLQIDFRITRRF